MSIVIDTPEGIRRYFLLSIYRTLKMEVDNPNGPKWRANPAVQARAVMAEEQFTIKGSKMRTRKSTLDAYTIFLTEKGILS